MREIERIQAETIKRDKTQRNLEARNGDRMLTDRQKYRVMA